MISDTATRVRRHSSDEANARIDHATNASVRYHARHPDRIDARLRALDAEWDVERVLEAYAGAAALGGTLLGSFVDRRFLALPAAVGAFLLQHALQGWCVPVPALRAMDVRTEREIDTERHALKALRGDYGPIGPGPHQRDNRVAHALQAARL
ncbi:YgaP-like transmembrane domain [Salinarimonas rosea]|uniref:YgaP-like transmembrane domain n=1 Tax=Salinarimonas rosea TaxID=552063 RepID=UPI00040E807F|nr:YgaP-like transmembrane domain [Salinarimonas rosea]